jgi:exodeoxyribonuclease-3
MFGTAILINPQYGGERPINVTYGIGVHEHDQEGRVITAEFKKYVLVSVYVPSSGFDTLKRLDYRKEWDYEFFKYVK